MGRDYQIYLTGFMGSGKSTIARYLHEIYNLDIVEMDEQIAEEQGRTIAEIFEQEGEPFFRELETQLLRRLNKQDNVVVSCGGGTVMRECNVQEMKKKGVIVLLCAEPETVLARVCISDDRPLLKGHMNAEYIKELMDRRMPAYVAAADVAVKTDRRSTGDICTEIMQRVDDISV